MSLRVVNLSESYPVGSIGSFLIITKTDAIRNKLRENQKLKNEDLHSIITEDRILSRLGVGQSNFTLFDGEWHN